MALFVVLPHRRDAAQPWVNRWIDSDSLYAITTSAEIASLCRVAQLRSERVFVHRCGWGDEEPSICCSVLVKRVGREEDVAWVDFREPMVLNAVPVFDPKPGQRYYEAPPAETLPA